MISHGTQRAKLRTKSGCLTCRSRRKKCDERHPTCQKCITSQRTCKWPTSEDLTDRRYAVKRASQALPALTVLDGYDDIEEIASPSLRGVSPTPSDCTQVSRLSEATAGQIVRRDVESLVAGHFASTYFRTILLPDCHEDFYHGWITDIQQLMKQHRSVYYSVLACSASQIYCLSTVPQMQELALDYYSRSIKEVSRLLDLSTVAKHDGLLNSIILLYLHGCLGLATFNDVPRHLDAAIQLIRLRLFDNRSESVIQRPFDRIALESVLYQVFITTMGSWLNPPTDFHFDAGFWLQAERLLSQSNLFPGRSASFNSPVLGTPLSLFKLVLSVKQFSQSHFRQDEETISQLKEELSQWEPLVWGDEVLAAVHFDDRMPNYQCYKDVALLYILIASLLLDQIVDSGSDNSEHLALQIQPSISWQVDEIRKILLRHVEDEEWSRCFIGCWPVYTVGFFMVTPQDQNLVRSDLDRRWTTTGSSQISRFTSELESVWKPQEVHIMARSDANTPYEERLFKN